MNRDDIKQVVIKHFRDTVEDAEEMEIDTSKSMKDLGANSLDIVEIVSCSMRELKIKIPRKELADLTNVDELIDLMLSVQTKAS